ncbi:hypothetical protein ONQ60_26485, partial [Salmonella enterica subsp. enterica serovar Virginia]|nr:hypothetical protein [Salmonella enterica subsp. enterica serovar Virginia]
KPRELQRQMAVAVTQAIENAQPLVVEAGTGTGKTYAYLAPALMAANYWLPGLVKGFSADFTDTDVGLIMSIPFIFAMFSMPWWG